MSSQVPPYEALGEDELEELGDDAIIAQQAQVHAPQPRAQVEDEKRSIVISDKPPPKEPSVPPPAASRYRSGRGEATVVIRDRRKLEDMRQQILARQHEHQRRKDKRIYVWAGAALAAFLLGGVVALMAGGSSAPAPALTASVPASAPLKPVTTAATDEPKPATVNLEDLPVEKRSSRRR